MNLAVPTALLVAGLLLACADPQLDADAAAHVSPDTAQSNSRLAAGTEQPASSPDADATWVDDLTLDDAVPIQTILTEWAIRLSRDTVRNGDYAFVMQNRTIRPHVVEVRGDNGMRWRSLPLPPGTHSTLAMALAPGTYSVSSTDTTYARRGMRSALVVTGR